MPSGTLQINNNTTFVPTIEGIVLNGCNWLFTQEMGAGTPIGAHSLKQGTVDLPHVMWSAYEISLTVKFYGLGPGQHSEKDREIKIECGRQKIGDDLLAHYGTVGEFSPLLDVDFSYHLDAGEHDIFVCTISRL